MTEILNYISAWVALLTAVLMLSVFLFDLASKKKSNSPRGENKKGIFPPPTVEGWLKKTLFPAQHR